MNLVSGGSAAARRLLAGPGSGETAPSPEALQPEWPELVAVATAGAVPYGYVLGFWTSPELALYTAIKFPAVLLVTLGLTFPLGWIASQRFGLELTLRDAARLTTAPLAVAALLLASLAPPALLFTLHIEPPSPEARSTHHALYILHTVGVAGAALFGTGTLWRGLRRHAPTRASAAKAYALWIVVYGVVAGEVAWVLRPFVGSVFKPVEFLRDDALDGNVYEFLFLDIVPHLLGA